MVIQYNSLDSVLSLEMNRVMPHSYSIVSGKVFEELLSIVIVISNCHYPYARF
jgi:hypothetical protein